MNTRAYLVAYLAPTGSYSLGFFSEPEPTVTRGLTAVVHFEDGRDYADARRALAFWTKKWVRPDVLRFGDDELRKALPR